MRFINTTTLQFEVVEDTGTLQRQRKYAIISHCWGQEEVTYNDFFDLEGRSKKLGWAKVMKACEIARGRNLELVWLDTCCINKESSAELTEAINSMYTWYRNSKECYAFMPDVQGSGNDSNFEKSRWFTRGWTLQELLAPWTVNFYDKHFSRIGTKTSLAKSIQEATGIDRRFLDPWEDIHEASVAQRLSWAASRKTTKPEDMAYSLLGIFGINMSLLYGEGDRAFLRLQLKIIKKYDDDSLFAWPKVSGSEVHEDETCGMLAPHPSVFESCGAVFAISAPTAKNHLPYAFTSRGVQLQVPRRWLDDDNHYSPVNYDNTEITVGLDCVEHRGSKPARLAIILRRSRRTGLWYRYGCEMRDLRRSPLARLSGYATVYVPQPELGQVVRRPTEHRRAGRSELGTLLVRVILRCVLVCGGLVACSYAHNHTGNMFNPLLHASMNLFAWGLWTILWVSMGSSSSLLLEMTSAGALVFAATLVLQTMDH